MNSLSRKFYFPSLHRASVGRLPNPNPNPNPNMGKPRVKKVQKTRNNNNNSKLSNPGTKKKKKESVPMRPRKKIQRQNLSKSLQDDNNDPILFGAAVADEEDDEEEGHSSEDLHRLLDPYSKDQLISLLADAAADDPALLSHIRSVADRDVAHRKIFVHGLGWDVTNEALLGAFRPFGPIEECNVVTDKATGRCKGFGFVLLSTRAAAVKALKEPQKKIGHRFAACQLASIGPVASGSIYTDVAQRRIYVSNVHAEASPDKLKALFASFGEIENGPMGFDVTTGKSRGFAIFVYKTQDGAAMALQEPYKMFEGHQLHCKLAFDHSQKGKLPAAPVTPQSLEVFNQQPAFGATTGAHNFAMLGQNPAYNMMLVQNPLLTTSTFNPTPLATLNPAALAALHSTSRMIAPQVQGYGRIGGGVEGSTMFGSFGAQGSAGLSYGGSQIGQSSSMAPTSGFFGGFP